MVCNFLAYFVRSWSCEWEAARSATLVCQIGCEIIRKVAHMLLKLFVVSKVTTNHSVHRLVSSTSEGGIVAFVAIHCATTVSQVCTLATHT